MKPIYLILLTLLTCCSSLKKSTTSSTTETKIKTEANTDNNQGDVNSPIPPKIAFLNYKAYKNPDKSIQVELVNKIITEGSIKKNHQKAHPGKADDFLCVQLDNNSSPVDSLFIPNPLIKDIEYVQTSGELGKKRIQLDSTKFTVRIQINPITKFISLTDLAKPNTTLLKTEI